MTELLSAAESAALTELEQVIASAERQVVLSAVEMGRALRTIRDARLYRAEHASFDAYCGGRWELRGQNADRLIRSATVADVLRDAGYGLPRSTRALVELAPLLTNHAGLVSTYTRAGADRATGVSIRTAAKALESATPAEGSALALARAEVDRTWDEVQVRRQTVRETLDGSRVATPTAMSVVMLHADGVRSLLGAIRHTFDPARPGVEPTEMDAAHSDALVKWSVELLEFHRAAAAYIVARNRASLAAGEVFEPSWVPLAADRDRVFGAAYGARMLVLNRSDEPDTLTYLALLNQWGKVDVLAMMDEVVTTIDGTTSSIDSALDGVAEIAEIAGLAMDTEAIRLPSDLVDENLLTRAHSYDYLRLLSRALIDVSTANHA